MKMTLEALNAIEKLTGNSLNLEWGVNALIATEKKSYAVRLKKEKEKEILSMMERAGVTAEQVDELISQNISEEFCLKITRFTEKLVKVDEMEAGKVSSSNHIHIRVTQRFIDRYNDKIIEAAAEQNRESLDDNQKIMGELLSVFSIMPDFITIKRNGQFYADLITPYNKDKESPIIWSEIPTT